MMRQRDHRKQQRDADHVRELPQMAHQPLEQQRSDQEQQRAADDPDDGLDVRMAVGMRQQDFIAHRRYDDSGDDRQVHVRIG